MKEFMRFVSVDVGDPICAHAYGVRPKFLFGIDDAIGIGSAAFSLGSSIFGGIKSSAAEKRAERLQKEQQAKDNAWYTRRYNENYADTAAGQNIIRKAKEYSAENWKKAVGSAAVGGATDFATALAKEQGNKIIADTYANMAAQDTARKDNVDNIHHNDEQKYTNWQVANEQQKANNIAQVAGQTSDAIMKAGTAFSKFNSGSTASNLTSGVSSIKAADVTKGVGKIKSTI